MSKEITNDLINNFENDFNSSKANKVAARAAQENGIFKASQNLQTKIDLDPTFSIEIDTGKVANQKQSGRCWMFSALNTMRHSIQENFKIKDFELSQNYTNFWDKFEKSNWFFENVIATADKDLGDRKVAFLFATPQQDGGQWDMLSGIIEKYGIVPKSAMVETFQSSSTRESDMLINATIRQFAAKVSKLYEENKLDEIKKEKERILQLSYNLLSNCFGVPPEKFDLEYVDKDENYHLERNLTPIEFFNKFIGSKIDEYQSVTNAPTKDKMFNKTFTVKYLGNVIEGKKVIHLNLEMKRLKELIISQLKNGEPVWFGSDVAFYRDRQRGIWDDNAFDYLSTFNLDLKTNKSDMLDYFISAMGHAMVITGVNLVDGKPTKWKIENSWGADNGFDGYYIMSDSFFDSFVYQAVILKKYLNEKELEALKEEPIELDPWDPMGTLA